MEGFEAVSFDLGTGVSGIPVVARVEYDIRTLRIVLEFEGHAKPIYLEFESVGGFRVLDEGQLSAFWGKDARPDGWLWEVKAGGWHALESSRADFILGLTPLGQGPREFIVLGTDDCVSVITWAEPRALVAGP
jgi:hypothetical protein